MTAFDLINSALRLDGVLAGEEVANSNDANLGLMVLNDMIDAWNAESQAIFTVRSDDFPFVGGQQVYTMGATGDFDIARPARIDGMSSILLSDPSNPIEVPILMYSVGDWQTQVPVKVVQGSFPQICYDDGNFPLRSLSFWPTPQGQPCSARIYSWQGLGAQTLTSLITFPPGYSEALRYNLAVRLGAEFAAPASAIVTGLAIQGLARIKTMNAPELGLRSDLVRDPAGWNYRADLFGMGF